MEKNVSLQYFFNGRKTSHHTVVCLLLMLAWTLGHDGKKENKFLFKLSIRGFNF